MQDLDTMRRQLADRNIQAVAKGAGVHPNARYRLMRGESSPRYETVQRVASYLQRQQQAAQALLPSSEGAING